MGSGSTWFRSILSLPIAVFCPLLSAGLIGFNAFADPPRSLEGSLERDIIQIEQTTRAAEASIARAYRAQAHSFDNATLMSELYTPRLWWAFAIPTHIENEIYARSKNSSDYFDLLNEAANELQRSLAHPRHLNDPTYFYNLVEVLLTSPLYVPSQLTTSDIAVVQKLFAVARAKDKTDLQNAALDFFDVVFDKNHGQMPTDLAVAFIKTTTEVDGLIANTTKQVPLLRAELLFKLGQQILVNNDGAAEALLDTATIFRDVARSPDEPLYESYLKPATYTSKGAQLLWLRDQLIKHALRKNPNATLDYCVTEYLEYFPAFANAEAPIAQGLQIEANIYRTIILQNASAPYYAQFLAAVRRTILNVEAQSEASQVLAVQNIADTWLNDILKIRPG